MNIDVADGLTNGTMGTVTNVINDQITGKMSIILVVFDSEHVGQETRYTSVYSSIHQNTVHINIGNFNRKIKDMKNDHISRCSHNSIE